MPPAFASSFATSTAPPAPLVIGWPLIRGAGPWRQGSSEVKVVRGRTACGVPPDELVELGARVAEVLDVVALGANGIHAMVRPAFSRHARALLAG